MLINNFWLLTNELGVRGVNNMINVGNYKYFTTNLEEAPAVKSPPVDSERIPEPTPTSDKSPPVDSETSSESAAIKEAKGKEMTDTSETDETTVNAKTTGESVNTSREKKIKNQEERNQDLLKKEKDSQEKTTTLSSELQNCPDPKEQESSSLYPPGFPQVLRAGNYTSESSHPYLSKDIWAELVDNKRTFFLRPYEDGFPNMTTLREWVASRPHPITILMNNYMDLCFPPSSSSVRRTKISHEEDERMMFDFMSILNETNLHALYVENFQKFAPRISMEHPKIKRLPRGHKWQFRTSWLYGESKARQKEVYTSISSSPQETKALFEQNRTATVWVRRSFKTTCLTNIFF
jgi:hypothetical protein